MATMGSGMPWGGQPHGNSAMTPIASSYSGPAHASVSHGGPFENGLPVYYPISSGQHNPSLLTFDQGVYSHHYHGQNQPTLTPGSEFGYSPVEYLQQDTSPTRRSFAPRQQDAAYSSYQQVYHDQQPERPAFVQRHSFHSDHHSSSYGGTPQPLRTPGADDGAEANTYESDHSQHVTQADSYRRMSRASNGSNTVLSPVSVPSSQISNDHAMGYPGTMSKRQVQHERTRQKNRMAASKCREKSKRNTDDLRARERDLTVQKQILTACAAELKDEVLALKHEILRHANCDCRYIQNYLAGAASQIS